MQSIRETLETSQAFLLGKLENSSFQEKMAFYEQHAVRLDQDLHQRVISETEIWPGVETLLTALGVPKEKFGRYRKAPISVYNFLLESRALLLELNQKQDRDDRDTLARLDQLIQLIDEKDKRLKKMIQMGAGISLAATSALGSTMLMVPGSMTLMQSLVQSVLFFPAVGFIFTIGVAAYTAVQQNALKNQSLWQRFSDNFFLLASTALNVSAYSVLFSASVAMNPVSAILFVVASIADFLKEFSGFIRLSYQLKKLGPIEDTDSLDVKEEKLRTKHEYIQARNAFVIKSAVAVIVVGIMATWCFMPASVFMTIGALVMIGIAYLLRSLFLSWNHRKQQKQLTDDFNALEEAEEKKNELTKTLEHDGQDHVLLNEKSPQNPLKKEVQKSCNSSRSNTRSIEFFTRKSSRDEQLSDSQLDVDQEESLTTPLLDNHS